VDIVQRIVAELDFYYGHVELAAGFATIRFGDRFGYDEIGILHAQFLPSWRWSDQPDNTWLDEPTAGDVVCMLLAPRPC